MRIGSQISAGLIGAAVGAAVLTAAALFMVKRAESLAAKPGSAIRNSVLVESYVKHSSDLLNALDILTIHEANAFLVAEVIAADCREGLAAVHRSDALKSLVPMEELDASFERVMEFAGRAVLAPNRTSERDAAVLRLDEAATDFVVLRDRLLEAAKLLSVQRTRELDRQQRVGWAALTVTSLIYGLFLFSLYRRARFQIVEPVTSLATAAEKSMLRGETFGHVPSGSDEVASLGQTIASFVANLEKTVAERTEDLEVEVRARSGAEEKLKAAHDELETKVDQRTRELVALNDILSRQVQEREQAQAESLELQQQLRQSQKMDAVGQLAGGVAHDFNNLLTVMLGYLDLLQGNLEDETVIDAAAQIQTAAERAADLTKKLLAFSRKQMLEPRVLDLTDLLQKLVPLLQRLIGEKIQLDLDLDQTAPTVFADPTQIELVVINLIVNARDAMPLGGPLMVGTIAAVDSVPGTIAPAGVESGPYAGLYVEDTGEGIPPEILERVFEPFFTTKLLGEGTGLGLSTVYGIVRQSGGQMRVRSEVGTGSRFEVLLPIAQGVESRSENPTPEVETRQRGHETILVVEDEPAVLELVRRALERDGYRVLIASDGDAALELAAQDPEIIDLVVSDIVLPGLSGPDLERSLRQLLPDLKIIFMSGYPERAGSVDVPRGPTVSFLSKPFKIMDLEDEIRRLLAVV